MLAASFVDRRELDVGEPGRRVVAELEIFSPDWCWVAIGELVAVDGEQGAAFVFPALVVFVELASAEIVPRVAAGGSTA